MSFYSKNKIILISLFSYILFICNSKNSKTFNELIISDKFSEDNKKYYIGGKYEIKYRQMSFNESYKIDLKA